MEDFVIIFSVLLVQSPPIQTSAPTLAMVSAKITLLRLFALLALWRALRQVLMLMPKLHQDGFTRMHKSGENTVVTPSCTSYGTGWTISSVIFADYGTSTGKRSVSRFVLIDATTLRFSDAGSCGAYTSSSTCSLNLLSSTAVRNCIGQASCTISKFYNYLHFRVRG